MSSNDATPSGQGVPPEHVEASLEDVFAHATNPGTNIAPDLSAAIELQGHDKKYSVADVIGQMKENDKLIVNCGEVSYELQRTNFADQETDPFRPFWKVVKSAHQDKSKRPFLSEGIVIIIDGTSLSSHGSSLIPNQLSNSGYLAFKTPIVLSAQEDIEAAQKNGYEIVDGKFIKLHGKIKMNPGPLATERMFGVSIEHEDGSQTKIF